MQYDIRQVSRHDLIYYYYFSLQQCLKFWRFIINI
jgi:hypothetical protein